MDRNTMKANRAAAIAFMLMNLKKQRQIKIESSKKEIQLLISRYSLSLEKQLLQYWRREQNSITINLISQYVNTGLFVQDYSISNTIEASALPGYSKRYFQKFREWLSGGLNDAGSRYFQKIIKAIRRRGAFRAGTDRISQFIESEALNYAVQLTNSRTLILREGLSFIVENDLAFSEAVGLLKENMVVTPRMGRAMRKRYQADRKAGVPKEEALRRARARAEKAKEWRSRLQIRTELNRAKNAGQREAVAQLMQQGAIGDVWKEWIRTTFVEAINHQNSIDNDGISVPENQLFPDGSYDPQEYNEQCYLDRFATPQLEIFQGGIT